jgi:hypothetical protein
MMTFIAPPLLAVRSTPLGFRVSVRRKMYATVCWKIDPNSIHSAEIKNGLDQAFATLLSTGLMANATILKLGVQNDLTLLGARLEALHRRFPTEFDYVCVGCEGGTPVAPASRATWDAGRVAEIIREDA